MKFESGKIIAVENDINSSESFAQDDLINFAAVLLLHFDSIFALSFPLCVCFDQRTFFFFEHRRIANEA